MTARPMTEEERAEALQRCLWFVINVAPEYAYGAWAELEPQARALLSSSSAERVMREALSNLIALASPHFSDPSQMLALSEARAALSARAGEDEQATRADDGPTAPTDR